MYGFGITKLSKSAPKRAHNACRKQLLPVAPNAGWTPAGAASPTADGRHFRQILSASTGRTSRALGSLSGSSGPPEASDDPCSIPQNGAALDLIRLSPDLDPNGPQQQESPLTSRRPRVPVGLTGVLLWKVIGCLAN